MSSRVLQLIMAGDASGFVNAVRTADRSVGRIQRSMKSLGSTLTRFGSSMGKIGMGLTAGVTLPLVYMGQRAVRAASDVREMRNLFGIAFSDIKDEANEAAEALSNAFDLNLTTAMRGLSRVADMLIGMNMSQRQALEYSKKIMALGGDLTSLYQIPGGAGVAGDMILDAIMGSPERLKPYGVNAIDKMIQPGIQERVAGGMPEMQAKVESVIEQINEQAVNAMGDYARTSDSLANRLRHLSELGRGLLETIGEMIIKAGDLDKVFQSITIFFENVINVLEDLPKDSAASLLKVVGAVTVIGPAITVLSGIILAFGTMITVIGSIIGGTTLLIIGAAIGAIAIIGYALVTAIMDLMETGKNATTAWEKFVAFMEDIGIPVLFVLNFIMGFVIYTIENTVWAIRSFIFWIAELASILWDAITKPWTIPFAPIRMAEFGQDIVRNYIDNVANGSGADRMFTSYDDFSNEMMGMIKGVGGMFEDTKGKKKEDLSVLELLHRNMREAEEATKFLEYAASVGDRMYEKARDAEKGSGIDPLFESAMTAGVEFGSKEAYSSLARHFMQTDRTEKNIERNTGDTARNTERMREALDEYVNESVFNIS